MFRPKYPEAPKPSIVHVPTAIPAVQHGHAPVCSCQHTTVPAPARPAGALSGLNAGTVGVVVTVGIVLTALLAAVAVTAVSVAVAAVVMRSLLASQRRR
ncbi:hypothetical protein QFW82_22520 [Streptomyces malaysiensis subsp. malaysiensis]|uniref:hypothetical protein n=1 Tax=Streptomyces malaysiensis TaxID=92644 RepID=UPI0024BFA392|nr:hypothetical protein [Streptomyces sp. NA07423]WHX19620.1 hypothetical protein QFW82_22520 [Streptomyces sp. NA07423]